jgi:hypothetical protein
MRRSASEIIRNLEKRIAKLENQRSAGYPQGYFDSDMYDAERTYYEPESKTFKDDYFDGSEHQTTHLNVNNKAFDLQSEIMVALEEISKELYKLQKYSEDSGDFLIKTFVKYVDYDSRRDSFKLSGGDYDRTKRVLMQGTLRDGYEDPFFKLTLDDANAKRDTWTIGCHMRFMSGEVVSHYINKGENYRRELKKWLDL